jgi:hypothetical protein
MSLKEIAGRLVLATEDVRDDAMGLKKGKWQSPLFCDWKEDDSPETLPYW